MKQIIPSVIKNIKTMSRGNSLAEFAVTTALMATLAATATPKLSELTETGRLEKTYEHIDKIVKQAGIFYQEQAESEGRGRFPGQMKFNRSIGGPSAEGYDNHGGATVDLINAYMNSAEHTYNVLDDLGLAFSDGWKNYDDVPMNHWFSVFGCDEDPAVCENPNVSDALDLMKTEWLSLFGDETLLSSYQDGHYVYTVVAGGGTGRDVYPPWLVVVDIENAVDLNNVLEP
tara:strand:- start:57 stop:746 length:690 start_codon:yes stop_codon:yes gene_type:complete